MENKSSVAHQRAYILKGILKGLLIGGLIGILVGFLNTTGIFIISGLNTVFSTLPFNEIIIPTLLGIIIGGFLGGILALYFTENVDSKNVPEISTPKQNIYSNNENVTLKIKEEQLEVAKKWMQTGEVKVYRESFSEEKSFTVPVLREELVIEKKPLTSAAPEYKYIPTEAIRIRLSEEQVEITKHRVDLEDVSIYKQQVEDIKHIEETLKREEAKVKISGSPEVKDDQI